MPIGSDANWKLCQLCGTVAVSRNTSFTQAVPFGINSMVVRYNYCVSARCVLALRQYRLNETQKLNSSGFRWR
jgi:hypothetical protein